MHPARSHPQLPYNVHIQPQVHKHHAFPLLLDGFLLVVAEGEGCKTMRLHNGCEREVECELVREVVGVFVLDAAKDPLQSGDGMDWQSKEVTALHAKPIPSPGTQTTEAQPTKGIQW